MTRTSKALISILATAALAAAAVPTAVGSEYSSPSATLGGQQPASTQPSGYSSPNAMVGDRVASPDGGGPTPLVASSSPNSILAGDGVSPPVLATSNPTTASDGFHWGDALLGAGTAVALCLMAAATFAVSRRRTRVEPGV